MKEKAEIVKSYRKAAKQQSDLLISERSLFKKLAERNEKANRIIGIHSNPFSQNPKDQELFPLMSHRLLGAIYHEFGAEDYTFPGSAVRKLVNAYLLPSIGIEAPEKTYNLHNTHNGFHYCEEAEIAFVDTLDQIKDIEDNGQPKISVYHNNNGPLLIRKSITESSAMLLVDGNIDGITVPKGTMVKLDSSMNENKSGSSYFYGNSRYCDFDSYYTNDICIAPGRISPWAHEPKSEYIDYFSLRNASQDLYSSERNGLIRSYEFKDYIKAANKILKLTGVKI